MSSQQATLIDTETLNRLKALQPKSPSANPAAQTSSDVPSSSNGDELLPIMTELHPHLLANGFLKNTLKEMEEAIHNASGSSLPLPPHAGKEYPHSEYVLERLRDYTTCTGRVISYIESFENDTFTLSHAALVEVMQTDPFSMLRLWPKSEPVNPLWHLVTAITFRNAWGFKPKKEPFINRVMESCLARLIDTESHSLPMSAKFIGEPDVTTEGWDADILKELNIPEGNKFDELDNLTVLVPREVRFPSGFVCSLREDWMTQEPSLALEYALEKFADEYTEQDLLVSGLDSVRRVFREELAERVSELPYDSFDSWKFTRSYTVSEEFIMPRRPAAARRLNVGILRSMDSLRGSDQSPLVSKLIAGCENTIRVNGISEGRPVIRLTLRNTLKSTGFEDTHLKPHCSTFGVQSMENGLLAAPPEIGQLVERMLADSHSTKMIYTHPVLSEIFKVALTTLGSFLEASDLGYRTARVSSGKPESPFQFCATKTKKMTISVPGTNLKPLLVFDLKVDTDTDSSRRPG